MVIRGLCLILDEQCKENMLINRAIDINNSLGWQATGGMTVILVKKLANK